MRLREIEYGLEPDGRLFFRPVSKLRADLHDSFRESIRLQRRALEWAIRNRRPGYPLSEVWFFDPDYWHFQFLCYRANCDLLSAITGKDVWSFGHRDGKLFIEVER